MSSIIPVIVVVEDAPQICRFLRTSLSVNGFQVIEAGTGERGGPGNRYAQAGTGHSRSGIAKYGRHGSDSQGSRVVLCADYCALGQESGKQHGCRDGCRSGRLSDQAV